MTAGRSVARLLLLCSCATGLSAQSVPLAYHPLQLDCADYHVQAASTILLVSGRERSQERTGSHGLMVLRARAADSAIALEAWFDSLALWREGSGQRLEPDTDGLIGGRYRALLRAQGGLTVTERPFIPDEVAQVSDLGDALAELLPPLPAERLAEGGAVRDALGTVIRRIPDGIREGRRVERYRLTRRGASEEVRSFADSSSVTAQRTDQEEGVYEWSAELGLVRWDRDIRVEVQVPAGGPVKVPFRTSIAQQVTIQRVAAACTAR